MTGITLIWPPGWPQMNTYMCIVLAICVMFLGVFFASGTKLLTDSYA